MDIVDIGKMKRSELEALGKAVTKEIAARESQNVVDATNAAEKALAPFGFTLKSLVEALNGSWKPKGKAKTLLKAKYRDPQNHEMEWSGMGRRPTWIREKLDAGGDLRDYLINPEA